ncbi:MAG: hypothetical protein JWO33_1492 [Caulobacteraceae bacterium]|nr:hypothetical protein [Caulobacteraceae bacterium]
MRKISVLVLALSTLAVAVPAAAQPQGGPGYQSPGADRRGDFGRGDSGRGDFGRDSDRRGDNGRDYDRRGFERELQQLNRRVEEDLNRGVVGKKVAKAFFNRIQELQRAEARARAKNGGWLRPDQRRDMDAAVEKVRSDLRLHEQRGGRR